MVKGKRVKVDSLLCEEQGGEDCDSMFGNHDSAQYSRNRTRQQRRLAPDADERTIYALERCGKIHVIWRRIGDIPENSYR